MAGKRQHFITSELQRGFSQNGKQVYRYTKNQKKPYLVNISKTGLQNNFYGKEGCLTDTQLTDFESRTTNLFQILRREQKITNPQILVKIVYISLIRSKNFRLSIEKLAKEFSEGIANALNKTNPCDWISASLDNNPTLLEESLKKQLLNRGYKANTPEFKKAFWLLMYQGLLNRKELLEKDEDQMNLFFRLLIKRLGEQNLISGKSIQARIVDRFEKDKFKILEVLKRLSWSVASYKENLLLGDSPVILLKGMTNYGIYHDSLNDLSTVVMPIGNNIALIGSYDDIQIPAKTLNSMSASISVDYFIAIDDQQNTYRTYIGNTFGIQHDRNWKKEALNLINQKAGWENKDTDEYN